MSLLYQHDSSRGYICGELNNFDKKRIHSCSVQATWNEVMLNATSDCSVVLGANYQELR